MDSEEKAELLELAKQRGLSMSELIRDAIQVYKAIASSHLDE